MKNSRVRDLVDLVIFCEHELLENDRLAAAIERVWQQRDGTSPPSVFSPLPSAWQNPYERLALAYELATKNFASAVALVIELWAELFPNSGTAY